MHPFTRLPASCGTEQCSVLLLAMLVVMPAFAEPPALPRDDGYRGIWYMNQPSKDEYKYSGGMATYPQQHVPIAVYAKEANKTFFCYGGVAKDAGADAAKRKPELLHMVSYYDHATGMAPRPAILLNKQTDDAHDNPTLQIDDQGHLWIFSSAHGTGRPSYIHRSTQPYSIDRFELVQKTNFSYTQPWYVPGHGFLFLHTRYSSDRGAARRGLFWMTSGDGLKWSQPQPLANIELGNYQVSWGQGRRVATAFDYHPKPQGLNARTNLYYLETSDLGKSWKTADGKSVTTPITEPKNPALVHDYAAEKLLVYIKDLQFDDAGRPIILYMTSQGFEAGPKNDPRTWHTARWTGTEWEVRPITTSDHNYDHGSLYVEADGIWKLIAPTEPGPQRYGTGGEMVLWTSADQGKAWKKVKSLTANSRRNHTYARRPVNAHPDFCALWADGDARQPSESRLYFTNATGDHVWRLPAQMEEEFARPDVAW